MAELPEPEQAVLLCELAALDIEYHRLAGENPSVAEYRARFPNLDAARPAALLARQRPREPGTTVDEHRYRRRPAAQEGLRYRILRPHARGGLGEVFVAEDQELHREVALKEIKEVCVAMLLDSIASKVPSPGLRSLAVAFSSATPFARKSLML